MNMIIRRGGSRQIPSGVTLPAASEPSHEAPGRGRRPPDWALRLAGLSLGGLAVGVAIGLRLPV